MADNEKEETIFQSIDDKYEKKGGEFYHNGDSIKKEGSNEEENVTEDEFNKIIQHSVNNFINRDFENIVVLIGAGASVVLNKDYQPDSDFGKTMSMMHKIVEEKLNEKTYELRGRKEEVYSLDELQEKIGYSHTSKENEESFDLEDFISHLEGYLEFVQKDDDKKIETSRDAIFDIIKQNTDYKYDSNKFKHSTFLKIVSKLVKSNEKLNIVTTNYDTVIEDAADDINFTVFDGFTFSSNPSFDSSYFDWNLVKDVPNLKTYEHIYKANVINLLKIHGSLTWVRTDKDKIIRKDKYHVKNPVMIFPSSKKYQQTYQIPYFELFAKFQELLKKPNTLLITSGFSFSDDHIARMIKESVKTNDGLSILVTDYDITDDLNKNWKSLVKDMENHFPIAFLQGSMNGNLTKYLGGKKDEN